ncbi:MAG: prepilin-type N-terminal cleavage/methylation domain-containing protein [bacterium]|nr:prepilin-type N-terminal cleavage/methylation domain-containing protein [bacterium]
MKRTDDKKMIGFYGSGFTLVELLVTMSILVVITSMILANYPKFSGTLALKRTAQEIALTVRQAQVYGLSVREFGAGSGVFPGYGVHFDIVGSPDTFVLFADINKNKSYDAGDGCGGASTECVQMFKINTGDKISKLCGDEQSFPPGDCSLGQLDIVYLRPTPTVTLEGDGSSFSDADIVVRSPRGEEKKIKVWLSGQIGVE